MREFGPATVRVADAIEGMESHHGPANSTQAAGGALRLRHEALSWREVGDELVVFNAEQGTYLTLNSSGAVMWRLLVKGTTEGELVQDLCERHDVPNERAAGDIRRFLASLRQRELLHEA